MSTIQMVPICSKFGYKKLRHEVMYDEERERVIVQRSSKNWFRLRRIPMRRRFRLKIPSLRRLWRKKARLVSSMKISCAKVMKRFKDGHVHFGDLFAGNYLFMQVSPASLNSIAKDISLPKTA